MDKATPTTLSTHSKEPPNRVHGLTRKLVGSFAFLNECIMRPTDIPEGCKVLVIFGSTQAVVVERSMSVVNERTAGETLRETKCAGSSMSIATSSNPQQARPPQSYSRSRLSPLPRSTYVTSFASVANCLPVDGGSTGRSFPRASMIE